MCSMLLWQRRLSDSVALLRSGDWNGARIEGREVAARILGVVGLGAVGSRVTSLAQAFGMKVLVAKYGRLRTGAYQLLPLEQLAEIVDFLLIAVPRRSETEGLISENVLSRMQSSSVLINVSRGGVVDEEALLHTLNRGGLAGAWIDVFKDEPVAAGHPLVNHPRVRATPHIAGSTKESLARAARIAGEDMRLVFQHKRPLHALNLA